MLEEGRPTRKPVTLIHRNEPMTDDGATLKVAHYKFTADATPQFPEEEK